MCLFIILASALLCFIFYEKVFSVLTSPVRELRFERVEGASFVRHDLKKERLQNESAYSSVYNFPNNFDFHVVALSGVKKMGEKTYLFEEGGYLDFEFYEKNSHFLLISPIEGLVTSLRVSFWAGFVGSSPLWMFVILRFISPGLRNRERKLIFPFLLLSFLFLLLGFLVSMNIIIPIANKFLYIINDSMGSNFWVLSSYLDYTLLLILSNSLAFELFVVLLFLVHLEFIRVDSMREKRRYAIVTSFVLGALLTPPDVFTQCLLAFSLILFYELAILYAVLRKRQRLVCRPEPF